MRRRKLMTVVATSSGIILAGCTGGNGAGGSTDENGAGGAAFELTADDGDITAKFDEDDISRFQILESDGSSLGSQEVSGAETRVTLLTNDQEAYGTPNYEDHIDENLEIIAFDTGGSEIESVEFSYSPDPDVVDANVSTDEKEFRFSIENSDKWPVDVSGELNFGEVEAEVEPAKVVLEGGDDRPDEPLPVVMPNYDSYIIEGYSTINSGGQDVLSLEYETSHEGSLREGLGPQEVFSYSTIQEAEDVESDVNFTAQLSIGWPDSPDYGTEEQKTRTYDIEINIGRFETEIVTTSMNNNALNYIPREMSVESINEN